jgi:hypothetical protein
LVERRAREWTLPRRANGGFLTAKRAARIFASLRRGSTHEKVRISIASARTPRAPTRNRRVSEDASSSFFVSRVPRFRGNRHPATRPGGGRDEELRDAELRARL